MCWQTDLLCPLVYKTTVAEHSPVIRFSEIPHRLTKFHLLCLLLFLVSRLNASDINAGTKEQTRPIFASTLWADFLADIDLEKSRDFF